MGFAAIARVVLVTVESAAFRYAYSGFAVRGFAVCFAIVLGASSFAPSAWTQERALWWCLLLQTLIGPIVFGLGVPLNHIMESVPYAILHRMCLSIQVLFFQWL